jgi:uncharacterized protein (TIGR03067 family)
VACWNRSGKELKMRRGIAVLAVLLVSLVVNAQEDAKKELQKFEGTWKVAAFEQKGQKADTEAFKEFKLTIKGDKFTFESPGDKMEGTIKVDPSKKPKALDVEGKNSSGETIKSAGIYELDKDSMKVCYRLNSTDRPKEFKTGPDSDDFLVIYQREKN